MPVRADIAKAYAHYYTHTSQKPTTRSGLISRLWAAVKRNYVARQYGYTISSGGRLVRFSERLLRLIPQFQADADGSVRFLGAIKEGRLLDVGCGSGDWILEMQNLGWNVTGLDLDEDAVKCASSKGLTVHCGTLTEQYFPTSTFDAITLNHVIEHVPDPVATLRECFRILKPGGKLVLFTPNGTSLGHRVYQEHWRGLEPPRHLHIFSSFSLRQALTSAGFQKIVLRPWVADSIIYESELLSRVKHQKRSSHSEWQAKLIALAFATAEFLAMRWNPSLADCVASIAISSGGEHTHG